MKSLRLSENSKEDASEPLVSVVITCKNNIDTIKETLESLKKQTFQNFEVIVVDSFSEDGTYEYLLSEQAKWDKLKVLREQGNPASGRNAGILKAKGHYIAFIDADAYAHLNWLETLINAIRRYEKNGIAGIGGPGEIPPNEDFNAKIIGFVLSNSLVSLNTRNNAKWKTARYVDHHPFFNAIYRKDIFEKVGLLDTRLDVGEDVELGWRVRRAGFKLLYIPNAVVYHHRRKSIVSLAKQMYRYGYWRMLLRLIDGSLVSLVHYAPSVLIIVMLSMVMLLVLLPLHSLLLCSILVPCLIYICLMLGLAASVAIKFKKLKAFPLAFVSAIITHISYGLGALRGIFRNRL